jgi:energy-coupling factor transporter ATP-binding protein EcfA2
MPVLRHIELRQHKGLKSALLSELEKINVVCGPNNSGKTTILECIANRNYVVGIEVSNQLAQSIAEQGLLGRPGWGNDPAMNDLYIRHVKHALLQRPIWFSNQIKTLNDGINWSFAGSWANAQGQLGYAFENAFPKLPPTVLIPAKRRLETSKEVRAFDEIWADGTGVLNFLFTAKNQDESSLVRKKFDAICSAFQEISAGYEFNVFFQAKSTNISPPPTNAELKFRRKGGNWIQAIDCGLGLQELLIILYFALASEHELVLIEEPENHLHPEIQRRLIAFLREKTEKQFFLSTHSSVFLNTQFADRVFACRMTDSVHVENATSRAIVLTELGYSIADNLVSDLVVLCEGPKDKPVLEEFFQKMGLLDRSNIKVWPLGGDIMDQLDLSVFQQSQQLIALIDNDPGSSHVRKRFLKKCEELNIPVTHLKRYSLENYFSMAAIASVMKGQMPAGIGELDPKKSVSDQLGFEVKKNGGKIAKEMKLEDIKSTDFEEFLHKVATLVVQKRN